MKEKILIVEDSENNRELCRQILEETYEVSIACDGEEGIRKAQADHFALILMDLSLPGINGWDATKKLKEAGMATPIVALTAHALAGDRERAINAGCDDFMTKPFLPEELMSLVKRNLKKAA